MKNKQILNPAPTGKHIINLYVDWDSENSGVFIQGDHDSLQTLLINAAIEDLDFGDILLDAAVKYLDFVEGADEEGGES
jgi:hypothetical protein